MSVSAERMDFWLQQAAQAAGLTAAAEAERRDEVYQAWAEAARPELGGRPPAQYAASLPEAELLRSLDESAQVRRGPAARLWTDEVVRRLRLEAASPAPGPLLRALAERAMAEPEDGWSDSYVAQAALHVLGQWGDPAAVPIILSALASSDPDIKSAACAAVAQVGEPALGPLRAALERARDPALRQSLFGALCRLPRHPEVAATVRSLWAAEAPGTRGWLAEGIGIYGDPDLAPLVAEELAAGPRSRTHWAVCRVALHRLGADSPVPPPPLHPDDPDEDLYNSTLTLVRGGLASLAREWVQEGVDRLAAQVDRDPAEVDWYLYEQFQSLADEVLARPAEVRMQRYLDYCYGALHYYGVLSLQHLVACLALAGLTAPPDEGALWAALKADGRFALYTPRLVALPQVSSVEAVLAQREESGLPPAIVSLKQMALTARGLAHRTWRGKEADAAQRLLRLLPRDMAQPERIVELQMAMRGAGTEPDALRRWLGRALQQGLNANRKLRDAIADLWNHTHRWELFGHTPAAAEEMLDLVEAQESAAVDPRSPCPCGSGRPFARCCGKR